MEYVAASPLLKSFLAGSFSGTCSTLLFQPLELVKTRQQAAVKSGKSNGVIAVTCRVLKNENIAGFWKGVTPSIIRCVPGVGVYFCSLHWLTIKFTSGKPTPVEAMSFGAAARAFAGVVMIPFTVVKTRFESGKYNYEGVLGALRSIYIMEGTKGLYCGLIPTLVRDVPFSGLYLLFYTHAKNMLPDDWKEGNISVPTYFCCGMVAGMFASVITQPADVIKTYMQLYPNRFQHIHEAVIHLYKSSGNLGFFTGLVPRLLRRTLMTAMAWTVYEEVMVKMRLK